MSFDDLMFAIIFAGIGLSGAYFGAAYSAWRRSQSEAERLEGRLRQLYINELRPETTEVSMPAITPPPKDRAAGQARCWRTAAESPPDHGLLLG
jgi:hypothetical protein